ncbi:MAG: acyl-ACP--UDP-N-acetylglucosamine O-acyltransferase [Phycisphaerae bacterium]
MRQIHPSATIEPSARLADDLHIGAGCYIGPDVEVGPGCRLLPNVVLLGRTTLGADNILYPNAVIGAAPQDLKYQGGDTRLVIGSGNVFRECVTVHSGTEVGGALTRIGDHNQFQVGSHIAHDCIVGDHCVLSNNVQVAGHVHIENCVIISGIVGIHQFVTVGRNAFISGMARVTTDVPPFMIFGYDGTIPNVNVKGLIRWGFTEEQCNALKRLYRQLFPRRGRETETNAKTWFEMLFSRRARRSVLSLSRRIADAEATGQLDDNCKYLLEFLKRSLNNGVFGRYLESARQDTGMPPPQFYQSAESAA